MKSNELLKILQDNPDLPIVFFTDEDTACDDYTWTFRKDFHVDVSTIYECDERICDCEIDAREFLENYYSDCEEYFGMTEEEYEKVIDNKMKELKQYKAIVLWVS